MYGYVITGYGRVGMEIQPRNFCRSKYRVCKYIESVYNAQAVIQHILLTLILFLTFHEASAKKLEEAFDGISMPRL